MQKRTVIGDRSQRTHKLANLVRIDLWKVDLDLAKWCVRSEDITHRSVKYLFVPEGFQKRGE